MRAYEYDRFSPGAKMIPILEGNTRTIAAAEAIVLAAGKLEGKRGKKRNKNRLGKDFLYENGQTELAPLTEHTTR